MSVWRQLTHGLRSLVRRRTVERETLDEVQQFLDAVEVDQIARGMSPAEAKRAVRLKYGSALGAQDDLRSFGWEGTVMSVLADVRHGVRLLRRTPGFDRSGASFAQRVDLAHLLLLKIDVNGRSYRRFGTKLSRQGLHFVIDNQRFSWSARSASIGVVHQESTGCPNSRISIGRSH